METMTLLDVDNGTSVRIIRLEMDRSLQAKLLQLGLRPGMQIRVVRSAPLDGPTLIEYRGRSVALGRVIASKVWVEVPE